MTQPLPVDPEGAARQLLADLGALPAKTTEPIRVLRRRYSTGLKVASADFVWQMALALHQSLRRGTPARAGLLWVACELIANHRPAFEGLDTARLETLGDGIQSWGDVDGFARALAGPAWLHGLIDDATVHRWARSPDLWWRRTALVCTIALNMRSQGGHGDARRTLAVCEMLAADEERMVQQALSWALRDLVVHDATAVTAFVDAHENDLSSRTSREVRHKLATGLKNPRRSANLSG
jgi:3-methyladenine DNA glycosylase AlkD